ncbi:MAG TPA: hypothetical protein V6C88_18080, partial [Chroococcidiopsis sp.]
MVFWEFLIQKDGDRSWLPLESPDVEILEGRYRVVARSSRVNTPVEIRISHDALDEHPPKRRLQTRSGRTNRDGLVVVIPFTRLHPGIWDLRCTSDVMADMMGDGWQHGVKLQVVSHDRDRLDDWEPDDWHSDETDAAAAAQREAAASYSGYASAVSASADSSPVAGAVPAADVDLDGAAAGIASAEESLIDPEAEAEAEVDGDTETSGRLEHEALPEVPVDDDDIPAAQRVDYDPDEVWLSADDAAASWDTALTDAEI